MLLKARGCGGASLAEVLDRIPKFDACASQGAAEFLGVQPNPRQVMSPNSSLTLPQDPFGMQAPKQEAGADAKVELCPNVKKGHLVHLHHLMVPQEIKEAHESPLGSSRLHVPTQSRQASFPEVGRPYQPEGSNLRLNVQATPELDVPLIDVFNELSMVKQECRQLTTQVETAAPTAAIGVQETAIVELVSRREALAARMERIENHLSTVTQDQSNAADASRTLWDRAEQCSEHLQHQATKD